MAAQPDARAVGDNELSEEDLYGPISSFAIEQDHPLVTAWPALRLDLIAVLERSPIQQRALEVYHRRRHYGPTATGQEDATVVVVAEPGDEKEWAALEKALYDTCRKHQQASLRVELVPGTVSRFDERRLVIYDKRPSMGSSMGVAPESPGGTLGGYLWLHRDGQWVLVAMTCHHVIRLTDQQGPLERPDETLRVAQPAPADDEYTREKSAKLHAEVLARMRKVEEKKIMLGLESSTMDESLARFRDQIATFERLQAEARGFDGDFGHAWATSGYRVAAEGCSLDWALVCVKEGREGSNGFPSSVVSLGADLATSLASVITDTAEAQPHELVVAFGKASGPVAGRFSAIKSDVWYPENGKLTTERVVTAVRPGAFQGPGDSGAWLVDAEGQLVGMLFGGPAGKHCSGPGYFTPIAIILEDIEARTGYKASLMMPPREALQQNTSSTSK